MDWMDEEQREVEKKPEVGHGRDEGTSMAMVYWADAPIARLPAQAVWAIVRGHKAFPRRCATLSVHRSMSRIPAHTHLQRRFVHRSSLSTASRHLRRSFRAGAPLPFLRLSTIEPLLRTNQYIQSSLGLKFTSILCNESLEKNIRLK